MEVAWIAFITTLFGGAGLKVIEYVLSKGQKKVDAATAMRDELRKEGEALKKEATELREEIRKVEKELDAWKEKYFLLLQDFLEIKAQLTHGEADEVVW